MLNNTFFRLLAFFLLINFTIQSRAQSLEFNPTTDTLIVGVAGSEPFIINKGNDDDLSGIAIELWEDLAKDKDWNYRYKTYNSVNDALNATENGELDLVVGPISITSQRVKKVRFSQPYYQSSLAIASRADAIGFWGRIKPFFSFELLIAVGVFLFILATVGTLFWLAERKASPEQFPEDPKTGIGNGMWLAIVTMSTTGYGDMAPVTLKGRIIAGVWMIVTIIFATSMVAGIASTLTLTGLGTSTINNIEELSEKTTATILGSPAESFIKDYKYEEVPVNILSEAMTKLKNKEVDAVIYDRPQLLYFQNNHNDKNIFISKSEYSKQGYGFAFPLNSQLVNEVNLVLLEFSENQIINEIVIDYLGKE